MARVVVKLIGAFRDILGPKIVVDVNENATIKDVILKLVEENIEKFKGKEKHDVVEVLYQSKIIINDTYSDLSTKVKDNDVITLITPAAGG